MRFLTTTDAVEAELMYAIAVRAAEIAARHREEQSLSDAHAIWKPWMRG